MEENIITYEDLVDYGAILFRYIGEDNKEYKVTGDVICIDNKDRIVIHSDNGYEFISIDKIVSYGKPKGWDLLCYIVGL